MMTRLTKGYEKHNNEFISYVADSSLYPEMMGYEYEQADMDCINKLGKLEDLEAELGIDLITLFKALKDGIYSRDYGHLLVEHFVLKSKQELHCRPTYRTELRFALKDYGKTWALSRNDLEEQDDE